MQGTATAIRGRYAYGRDHAPQLGAPDAKDAFHFFLHRLGASDELGRASLAGRLLSGINGWPSAASGAEN